MSSSNVRRLDRMIQDAERKLGAVERRELWPLTGSERTTLVTSVGTGTYKAARGKSTGAAERRIETVWSTAAARLRAEIAAATREKDKAVADAAGTRVARKSKGWW